MQITIAAARKLGEDRIAYAVELRGTSRCTGIPCMHLEEAEAVQRACRELFQSLRARYAFQEKYPDSKEYPFHSIRVEKILSGVPERCAKQIRECFLFIGYHLEELKER